MRKQSELQTETYNYRGAYLLHIFYFIRVAIFQFCNTKGRALSVEVKAFFLTLHRPQGFMAGAFLMSIKINIIRHNSMHTQY